MSITPNVVLLADTGKILYNVVNGVFIQHVNGSLYTVDKWVEKGFSNEEANGVAVRDSAASFVVATTIPNMGWNANGVLVEGVITTKELGEALADFAGQTNTSRIKAKASVSAAATCANYTFPNGTKGYLPALGEMSVLFSYKSEITDALTHLGVSLPAESDKIWTSTQADAYNAWSVPWRGGNPYSSSKATGASVFIFTSL